MNGEDILKIFMELKGISMAQRDAILQNDINSILFLQDQRRDLIKKIQNIAPYRIKNSVYSQTDSTKGKDVAISLKGLLEEIVMLDNEIKQYLKENMSTIIIAMTELKWVKKNFVSDRKPKLPTIDITI